MTAIDDFARCGLRARNGCGDDCPVSRTDGGSYLGLEHDLFASLQTRSKCLRSLARNHEGEAGRLAGVQMAPADKCRIKAGPCSRLIGHLADDAGGPGVYR